MVGTANLIPAAIVEVWHAVQDGDIERARKIWDQVYPVMDAVMQEPYVATVKAVLGAVGFPVGVPQRAGCRGRSRGHGSDRRPCGRCQPSCRRHQ